MTRSPELRARIVDVLDGGPMTATQIARVIGHEGTGLHGVLARMAEAGELVREPVENRTRWALPWQVLPADWGMERHVPRMEPSPVQDAVLAALEEGPLTVREITMRTGAEEPSVRRALERLECRSAVRRDGLSTRSVRRRTLWERIA